MDHQNSHTILSMGVDWITVVGSDETSLPSLRSLASELVTFRLRGGFKRTGWGMAGFSGVQSLGVQYGIRNKEVIVRLSGDLAHIAWRRIYELGENCTRIDLELTARCDGSVRRRVRKAYREARRVSHRRVNAPAVTLVDCTTGGTTCYLGKRCSGSFGRVYDKEAESGLEKFRGAVRYEVEYKGAYARQVARALDQGNTPLDRIAGYLQTFFRARGVAWPYSSTKPLFLEAPARADDHQRSLKWIRDQVRPTVQRLIECGLEGEVFEALGFGPKSSTVEYMDQPVQYVN